MLSNESHFQNPEFDALLATARSTLDFEEHRSAYPAAQQLIAEEGGNLIPYHVNEFYIMSAAIQGVPAQSWLIWSGTQPARANSLKVTVTWEVTVT